MSKEYYEIYSLSPTLFSIRVSQPESRGMCRGVDYFTEEHASNYFSEAIKKLIKMGNNIMNIVPINEGRGSINGRYSTTSVIFVFVEPTNKHPLGN